MRPVHIQTYLRLAREVIQIAAGDSSAELKYNLIFSSNYSQRLHGIMPLDYYDPDTSYEDDVEGARADLARMRFGLASHLLIAQDRAYFRYTDSSVYSQAWVYDDLGKDIWRSDEASAIQSLFGPSAQLADFSPAELERSEANFRHLANAMPIVVWTARPDGQLDFGPWEQIFYGEFDGRRKKRVLVKIIGD